MSQASLRGRPASQMAEAGIVFDGPILLYGGCYSNLEATRSLLCKAQDLGIPPERMICTGDVVAYGADPQATVDLIRQSGVHVIMGNCEEALGFGAPNCGCGFAEGSICSGLAEAWFAYADAHLDNDARAWMRSLPRRLDIVVAGWRLAVVHGSTERINEFVFASIGEQELAQRVRATGMDGIIGGHCGLPFTVRTEGKFWHNPGAIGMPANDGTDRTWFSILDLCPSGPRLSHMALNYDSATAAAKVRAAGLPEGYALALETGSWPSCEVLPPAELAARGCPITPSELNLQGSSATTWPSPVQNAGRVKFSDPHVTATGAPRASVALRALKTLWFNTGTLCNLTCSGCYTESSPRNDRLAYITREEVLEKLAEAKASFPDLEEIGFTGGEPFMNPDIMEMMEDALEGGWRVLVLTNAMKPMQRHKAKLLDLQRKFPERLALRVSIDHYTPNGHEEIRGALTWQAAIDGLVWLTQNGFDTSVAARKLWDATDDVLRDGYRTLFERIEVAIDADDPAELVLFPEMDERADVAEITAQCWALLHKSPDSVMCATSRMVVKRKGAAAPTVVSCTLLPYDEGFEMGQTLAEASRPIALNHVHCSRFCVLGNASCSAPR